MAANHANAIHSVGAGVTGFAPGQKVAALTVHGGFAEHLARGADHFVPVPAGLDDAETVAVILNYVTAYQRWAGRRRRKSPAR